MRADRTTAVLSVLFGVFFGVGAFTFRYAEGFSYFSTDPRACVNCHIMQPQFDSWQKASHHGFATCVDCHLPHDFLGKYAAKASNGYHHSKGFTLQDFREPIRLKQANLEILQRNCIACHSEMVYGLVAGATTDADAVNCLHCHAGIGHGETVGVGGADRGERKEVMRDE